MYLRFPAFPIISPQGDGNLSFGEARSLAESFPIISPQGDGNRAFAADTSLTLAFSDHFPARGWKPNPGSLLKATCATSFPIISPQGDGNHILCQSPSRRSAAAFPIISPQGDGNSNTVAVGASTCTLFRSFPRKGMETIIVVTR